MFQVCWNKNVMTIDFEQMKKWIILLMQWKQIEISSKEKKKFAHTTVNMNCWMMILRLNMLIKGRLFHKDTKQLKYTNDIKMRLNLCIFRSNCLLFRKSSFMPHSHLYRFNNIFTIVRNFDGVYGTDFKTEATTATNSKSTV